MSLRHAAALAIVGWYLLVPPIADNPTDIGRAPLSEWINKGSYDTAAQCRDALNANIKYHLDRTTRLEREPYVEADVKQATRLLYEAARSAQCVATDDPRLKIK